MDFNFEQGGEDMGRYYPPLKNVNAAIKSAAKLINTNFYIYEPGNATRYEVLFSTYDKGFGPETVMTLVNFRKSMVLSGPMGMYSLGYMQEKLQINEGDCYALVPLINQYFEELGS